LPTGKFHIGNEKHVAVLVSLFGRFSPWPFSFVSVSDGRFDFVAVLVVTVANEWRKAPIYRFLASSFCDCTSYSSYMYNTCILLFLLSVCATAYTVKNKDQRLYEKFLWKCFTNILLIA